MSMTRRHWKSFFLPHKPCTQLVAGACLPYVLEYVDSLWLYGLHVMLFLWPSTRTPPSTTAHASPCACHSLRDLQRRRLLNSNRRLAHRLQRQSHCCRRRDRHCDRAAL